MTTKILQYRLRQSTALALGGFIGALAIGASLANADDFIVDTNTTVKNGGNGTLGPNDSITVTSNGSIATLIEEAIVVFGINNIVTNNGFVSTAGFADNAIVAADSNTIINNGSITTAGDRSLGIRSVDSNTITNNGSISTLGEFANGIQGVDDNNITNNGSISTLGDYANGIYLRVGDGNIISNNGSITTKGDRAEGISASHGNNITNSGSITVTGEFSKGIAAGNDNVVSNSGSVVSAQSFSIFVSGNNNTLNLNAPSFIGGRFLVGNNGTLNITTGASHSILWTFDPTPLIGGAPNISGPVPVFQRMVSGSPAMQVATFDPTMLSASSEALAGSTSLLSSLMQQRLNGKNNSPGLAESNLNSFLSIQQTTKSKRAEQIDQAFDEASSSYMDTSGPQAWLSVFGSRSTYDGSNAILGHDLNHWGIAGGYDWVPSGDLKFGFLGGYMNSIFEANSKFATSYDNDTSGFFAGFYGRKDIDAGYVNFALTGGVYDHNQNRFVNDNLAPLGVSGTLASYNSYWISPEITIGTHMDMANGWVASPSAKFRYASQWIDGYTESGFSPSAPPPKAPAKVASRNVAIGEAAIEWAATKTTRLARTTLHAGYFYRTSFGDSTTSVTMLDQTFALSNFDQSYSAVYLGGEVILNLSDTITLELGSRVEFGNEFTGFSGNAKLVATF